MHNENGPYRSLRENIMLHLHIDFINHSENCEYLSENFVLIMVMRLGA